MIRCITLFFLLISTSVLGSVTTASKVVTEIRIQRYQGDAYYYFTAIGNDWLAPGCQKAKYAYIKESDAGSQAILSIVLTAKATQTPVIFTGTCGDINGNLGYMQITDIRI
ncbi:hypothetical protein [Pseudoalteromonas luteoviolacea]|uniref:Uncharacterized protein n=1 Tax=Pseudoalteromonas luteoviolacea S4060-1 TaxID=1365257 RepID=A0A162CJE0_9GAMM|nr:hypothetical protein [Pseudoalteromonas luteoviolacea]KZN68811.1 hypothetical protein N478_14200 [Pseudoalteromonas luteoviolacea S4060-1]